MKVVLKSFIKKKWKTCKKKKGLNPGKSKLFKMIIEFGCFSTFPKNIFIENALLS